LRDANRVFSLLFAASLPRGFFCVCPLCAVVDRNGNARVTDADDADDAHFALRTTRKKKKTA
jgi:hypothetical protein